MLTDPSSLGTSEKTSSAALACMKKIASIGESPRAAQRISPFDMGRAIVDGLNSDEATSNQVWIARADEGVPLAEGMLTGAWSFRFTQPADRFEKPLIYFLRTEAGGVLRAAFDETRERGIFFNAAETISSRWAKGVRPEVPLWLSSHHCCIPYDPASDQEAHAIVLGALQAFYVDGLDGCCYLNLHDESRNFLSELPEVAEVFSGMYRVRSAANKESAPQVRLCGAGKALHRVLQAADCLQEEWGVCSEVWSCPSYTRLAREGQRVEQWNMMHPLEASRHSHISACLHGNRFPVIAVTDYGQHVAGQIGAFVQAPFTAAGADSTGEGIRYANVEWIVTLALKVLVQEGTLSVSLLSQALHRYEHKSEENE